MSGNVELTCKELVELATEYLSHTMTVEDQTRFEQHLATCPGCTTYLEQLETTVAQTGGLQGGALPSDVERDLLALFRRWKQK